VRAITLPKGIKRRFSEAAQGSISESTAASRMSPKVTKNTKEKFRKRKNTILEKADQLRSLCQADVYVLLRYQGKYYAYKSTDEASWPPSSEGIVRHLEWFQVTLIADRLLGKELSVANHPYTFRHR